VPRSQINRLSRTLQRFFFRRAFIDPRTAHLLVDPALFLSNQNDPI